jgi:glucose-1-phosphate cytidylyltransferase
MKYYAHFGHKDFILCLGYKADKIKDYFLNYNECLSNDFTMTDGGKVLRLQNSDISDWTITFVDTGLRANIGQRLKAVEEYLAGEEMFLANYSDGLTDLSLPDLIEFFTKSGKVACCMCAKPPHSYHVVTLGAGSSIDSIRHVRDTDTLINAGFFVFKKDIFNYIRPGEELVVEPFNRLIEEKKIVGYHYERFWCMDTFKEHQELTDMYNLGNAPWQVWKRAPTATAPTILGEYNAQCDTRRKGSVCSEALMLGSTQR